MDNIISKDVVEKIYTHLKEINSIGEPNELIDSLEKLFDGEEELLEATENLATEVTNVLLNKANPSNMKDAVTKYIMSATLLGFISERYTRDIKMDTTNIMKDLIKRDYETLQTYLSKKVSDGDDKSLTQIAEDELKR
jgi:hypothetical protein